MKPRSVGGREVATTKELRTGYGTISRSMLLVKLKSMQQIRQTKPLHCYKKPIGICIGKLNGDANSITYESILFYRLVLEKFKN